MKKTIWLLPTLFLFGCSNTIDAYNGFRASWRNGMQEMKIEIAPSVSQVAKLEDVKLLAALDDRFDLVGLVTYGKSCKNFLTMDVRLYNAGGEAMGNTSAVARAYIANEKAQFRGSVKQNAGKWKDLVSRVVVDNLKCI